MSENDVHIVHPLRDGNAAAFRDFFHQHYKPLVLKAWTLLEDEMEAEDTVQKLFTDLWENKFWNVIKTSPEAYIYTALRNRCLKIIRKRKTELSREQDYAAAQDVFAEEADQFEEPAYPNLEQVMNDMPRQRLQTLNLVYLENKKYREAADEMGISINSVKTHLKLALKHLRNRIGK